MDTIGRAGVAVPDQLKEIDDVLPSRFILAILGKKRKHRKRLGELKARTTQSGSEVEMNLKETFFSNVSGA